LLVQPATILRWHRAGFRAFLRRRWCAPHRGVQLHSQAWWDL